MIIRGLISFEKQLENFGNMNISIKQLRAFLALAETGNLT